MRWLDIDLTRHDDETVDIYLERAQARRQALVAIQHQTGLDSPQVMSCLEEIGQLLFRAARAADETAFAPDRRTAATAPSYAPGDKYGYHLVVDKAHLTLPWTALHNGLHFLIEQTPICASSWGSHPDATAASARQWMRRREDDIFTQSALGPASVGELVTRYRPEDCAEPSILFLDGQAGGNSAQGQIERDMLDGALETLTDGRRLARLEVPTAALTPARLARTSTAYKAFHFSGATSVPPADPASPISNTSWDSPTPPTAYDQQDESDLEIVGVDPITSMLDQINEKADSGRLAPWTESGALQVKTQPTHCWQLDDGPLRPEDLAGEHVAPPLVFSNSYLSLAALGARFLNVGTSVFVGPQLALSPGRASEFAADFYHALARGDSAAEALREAALAGRQRWGAHHPAWLAYGIIGSGTLALQYL
jgi:hypothetical protein